MDVVRLSNPESHVAVNCWNRQVMVQQVAIVPLDMQGANVLHNVVLPEN